MKRTALFLSLRYLRGKSGSSQTRRRMIGAILGIAVSLLPLLLVLQVAEGMIEGITGRYVEVGTFHMQVRNYSDDDETDIGLLTEAVADVRGVEAAFPVVEGTSLLYSEYGGSGAAVRGLPRDLYESDGAFRKYILFEEGGYALKKKNSVLVSSQMAEKLQIHEGDKLKMLTGKSFPGRPVILRPSILEVTGIFTTGYRDLDTLSVIVPFRKGAGLFTDPGAVSLGIKVADPYGDMRETVWRINRVLPPGWYVYTWYELEKSMYKSLENTKNLLFFIMAMILVVASVNISSTIVMIVMERQRDIAILKSIGAGPEIIRRTFLFTGLWIGVAGTFIGMLAGVALSVNVNEVIRLVEQLINGIRSFTLSLVYPSSGGTGEAARLLNPDFYLSTIPINLRLVNLLFISVLSVFLSLAAAFFPARRAGKTYPLDILRRF